MNSKHVAPSGAEAPRGLKPALHERPTVAVFKFASCDGCQLSLLDAEDELLGVAQAVDIVYFPEATSIMRKGP
jgi:coenzyme F420-reducing hydrogenase gamma subunit